MHGSGTGSLTMPPPESAPPAPPSLPPPRMPPVLVPPLMSPVPVLLPVMPVALGTRVDWSLEHAAKAATAKNRPTLATLVMGLLFALQKWPAVQRIRHFYPCRRTSFPSEIRSPRARTAKPRSPPLRGGAATSLAPKQYVFPPPDLALSHGQKLPPFPLERHV